MNMSRGPARSDGTVLYYVDSGVPNRSLDYTTVFLIHGTVFSSAIFRRMIPYAPSNNLRLVLVNCRDYPGSTQYSPAEIEALGSPNPTIQLSALQSRGSEFAEFIRWFIQTMQIPEIGESDERGKSQGGFSLLGWSSGNCQTVPLLAYASLLPEQTRFVLEKYFRSFILYDISLAATGQPYVAGVWTPFRDPLLSLDEKFQLFSSWVSYYFTPAPFSPSDDADSPAFEEALISRVPMHEKAPDNETCQWMPTVHRIGPKVLPEVCHIEVMARSQRFYQTIDPAVYQENIRLALLVGNDGEDIIWPNLKIHVVWCDMTNSDTVSAGMRLKALVKKARQGGQGRDVAFHKLENANHFVHWDEPERVTTFLATIA